MQIETETFAEVPVSFAYAWATGFEQLEKIARDAGLTVEPLTDRAELGDGHSWYVTGKMGAMHVDLLVTLAEMIPDERLTAIIVFKDIWFDAELSLDNLGAERCSIKTQTTGKARGLKARFLLKGLSMAEGKLATQLDRAMRRVAKRLEREYHKS